MDIQEYQRLADEALKRLFEGFDALDPELADSDFNGDVLTVSFANGSKCVLNTQRAAEQIWLSAEGRGRHFAYNVSNGAWIDTRDSEELFSVVQGVMDRATRTAG